MKNRLLCSVAPLVLASICAACVTPTPPTPPPPPPEAPPPPPPPPEFGPRGYAFFLKNNSSVPLTCRGRNARPPNAAWGMFHTRAPGGEWQFGSEQEEYRVHCQAPVVQISYTLRPGRIYSLQRSPPGGPVIRMVEVNAN